MENKLKNIENENCNGMCCGPNGCVLQKKEKKNNIIKNGTKPILFTTVTCPNCKVAKMLLANANFDYEMVDASENIELCNEIGIKNVPTLVISKGDMNVILEGTSEIKKYLEGKN